MNEIHVAQVLRLEEWGEQKVRVAVAWEIWGKCGCIVLEGSKLGSEPLEPMLGFRSCDKHEREMSELYAGYQRDAYNLAEHEVDSPDGERPLHEVLLERLRAAIG